MYASTLQESIPRLPVWKVLLGLLLPSLIFFVAIDLCWISLIAGPRFQSVLGASLRQPPDPLAGLLAWLLIVSGVLHFASSTAKSKAHALAQGLALGLVIYGTYEFTNYAVIAPWTWGLAAMDTFWGSFACGCTAVVQQHLGQWLSS